MTVRLPSEYECGPYTRFAPGLAFCLAVVLTGKRPEAPVEACTWDGIERRRQPR